MISRKLYPVRKPPMNTNNAIPNDSIILQLTMLVSTLEEVAIATECCSAIAMDTLPSITM